MTPVIGTAKQTLIVIVLLLSPLGLLGDLPSAWADEALQAWLNQLAILNPSSADSGQEPPLAALERFYHKVGHRPVWVDANGLNQDGAVVQQAMASATENGLDPNDYLLPGTEAPWIHAANHVNTTAAAFYQRLIRWDVALTSQVVRYALHLSHGRVPLDSLGQAWTSNQPPPVRDLPAELATAVLDDRLPAFFDALPPEQAAYVRLQSSLKHYERIRAAGGWPTVSPGPSLRLGDQSLRVADLRRRLTLSGDLKAPSTDLETVYDRTLEAAVMRFQFRHGLVTDGVVGRQTLATLAVPVDDRIRQLQLNMERWRWYPQGLGSRYLMVNVPDFTLSIVNDGWVIRQMRTIVGQPARQTPILSGRMTYLDLNPYWNIPRRLAREDILPKILEDPTYLDRQGIQVFAGWHQESAPIDPWRIDWNQLSRTHFPYRLRQDPSPVNALGRIKFMFPNRQSIYIHDTPGKSLFNREQRIFSSGCVRVETPLELAAYLLEEQGWHRPRLEAVIASGRQQVVILNQPMDVYLVYFTAWVDESGQVHFRDDVYGRDRDLQLAIDRQSGPLLRCPIDDPSSRLLASCSLFSR